MNPLRGFFFLCSVDKVGNAMPVTLMTRYFNGKDLLRGGLILAASFTLVFLKYAMFSGDLLFTAQMVLDTILLAAVLMSVVGLFCMTRGR